MSNLGTLVISSKKLKISMDNRLIKWNTGRIIKDQLNKLEFFENYSLINKEMYDIYIHLKEYARNNYNGNAGIYHNDELYKSLVSHLDNMVEFQKMVESNDPTLDLANEAKARFDNENVRSTKAVNTQEIARLELLLEYARPVRILFNNLVSLTNDYEHISAELVDEIQEVVLNKGLDHFDIPDELLINNNQNQTV